MHIVCHSYRYTLLALDIRSMQYGDALARHLWSARGCPARPTSGMPLADLWLISPTTAWPHSALPCPRVVDSRLQHRARCGGASGNTKHTQRCTQRGAGQGRPPTPGRGREGSAGAGAGASRHVVARVCDAPGQGGRGCGVRGCQVDLPLLVAHTPGEVPADEGKWVAG